MRFYARVERSEDKTNEYNQGTEEQGQAAGAIQRDRGHTDSFLGCADPLLGNQ